MGVAVLFGDLAGGEAAYPLELEAGEQDEGAGGADAGVHGGVGEAALEELPSLVAAEEVADEAWAGMLGPAGRRGLTPLFWQHVRPHGEVRLDMGARLRIGGAG